MFLSSHSKKIFIRKCYCPILSVVCFVVVLRLFFHFFFLIFFFPLSIEISHASGRWMGALLLISTDWYTISSLHIWTNILQENHFVDCASSLFNHENYLPEAIIEYIALCPFLWTGLRNYLQIPVLVKRFLFL